MSIKETIEQTIEQSKDSVAHAQRRAEAVVAHAKAVLTTGAEVAQNVASVAAEQVRLVAQAGRSSFAGGAGGSAPTGSIRDRMQLAREKARTAFASGRGEIGAALHEGFEKVGDRLAHVLAVSNAERAEENKLNRKAKKAKKRQERFAAAA